MKCIIIYFSQSGNTKKIARAIWRGMNPWVEQCDLVSIEQVDPRDVTNYDLIGIGSPTGVDRLLTSSDSSRQCLASPESMPSPFIRMRYCLSGFCPIWQGSWWRGFTVIGPGTGTAVSSTSSSQALFD